MMRIVIYFTLKALFVLEILKFLPCLFGYVEKWLDKKVKVNFKIYDVKFWETNDYNTHIIQSLREKRPNTEFFLVRMRENTDQKKLRIWTHFTQ